MSDPRTTPESSPPESRCGVIFPAWDGAWKCGRVAGHLGAHTRDPLPGERNRLVLDASALPEGEAERIAAEFPGVEFQEQTYD